jgi:hypothetical protein
LGEDEDLKSGTEVGANFRSESESGVKALEVDRSVCVYGGAFKTENLS